MKLEKDPSISETYGKVSELLRDASEGRNFYEHLDQELEMGGIGTRGRGFSYPQGYHFSFVRIEKGQPVEKKVNLGMEEVAKIGHVYRELIATLKARGDSR